MNKNHAPRLPDDLEKELSEYYGSPAPSPEFISRLERGLHSKLKEQETKKMFGTSKMKPAWGFALAMVVALIILLAASPTIVTALKRMLGYIPGVGMVDDSSTLRVLAEPVSLTRDGITVKVEEAVLAVDKTVIRFTLDGIPLDGGSQDITKCDTQWGGLRLSDGSVLQTIGGHGLDGWDQGFEARYTFEPMPADVNQAIFIPPCLREYIPGALPENWGLTLRFVPAPAEMTVIPVSEVTPSQATSGENPLVLEKVIETEKGYMLAGTFHSMGLPQGAKAVQFANWPRITDASGQEVSFTLANYELGLPLEKTQSGVFSWAFEIDGKSFNWPLTIRPDLLAVEYENAQAQFEFDAGPNPQNEQVWDLNVDLDLAGYAVRVVRVIGRSDGYEFFFESPQMFHGITLEIQGATEQLTGMNGVGEFSSHVKFAGGIPTNKLIVLVTHPIVAVQGSWQLQWQPENASAPSMPAQPTQTCLTLDSWNAALANPAPIPAGLSGKVFGVEKIGAGMKGALAAYTANLDGSNKQEIGEVNSSLSPSPDGAQLVYAGHDGLYIEDLATGESRHLSSTSPGDFPIWSPDGMHIAFGRDVDLGLYIINPDGTGLQKVDVGPEYEKLLGWSADNTAIFYSVYATEGTLLRKLDLATGTVSELFNAGANGSMFGALSLDGTKVAFFSSIAPTVNGLYISRLDGSDRRLIAQMDVNHGYLNLPVWSPDGKWLVLKIDANTTNSTPIEGGTALVNLETCQILPLPISGQIVSWIP